MSLLEISRGVAAGIPGAKVLQTGGIEFVRRGFPGRVEFPKERSTDILFATGALAPASLAVWTAGLWHDVRNLLGHPDYRVGEPGFDAAFEIVTSERGFAARILTPEARKILGSIALYGRILWRLSRAGFLLRVHAAPAGARELDAWLVGAFQLLDAVPGALEAGRVRLEEVRVRVDEASECQICGASLARGAVVRCAKCATPHHRDCWEFNGRCSTFACGESRAV